MPAADVLILPPAGDAPAAFAAYERFLKPHVARKQRQAARMAARFVPRAWRRRVRSGPCSARF